MDVAALAIRLRAIAADLPGPGLVEADTDLATALAGLGQAAEQSVAEVGLHRLGVARERLDAARTSLDQTRQALDHYLASIGAAAPAPATAAAADAAPAPAPKAQADPRRWWTERVNELCRRGGESNERDTTPTRLFNELVRLAAEGDAEAYCAGLRDAGPRTGVRLPGLAWPLMRSLAAEHLGRAPALRDLAALRDRCAAKVHALVPGAEPAHLEAVLASACTLGRAPAPAPAADDADPARTAALGPAVVAALHALSRPERKART